MADTVKKASTSKAPRKTASVKAATGEVAPKKVTPSKKAVKTKVTAMAVSHERIAELAHRYWAERGRQHGHDAEDWLRAERELLGLAS
ncbi:MAG: DUF2934 domain-containing protein [Acidobacteriota bacterium]|nr:DUF2934 domain-containing protein [Acidobacteriota bacterium]